MLCLQERSNPFSSEVASGLPHINYKQCNLCNLFNFSGKIKNKLTSNPMSPSIKPQFLSTNTWMYVLPVLQSFLRYPETSLSMKPKGNYTVIDFIVIAIWHCASQPLGSQFLFELRRLSIMALMKSLSVCRGVRLRTDSAPKLNHYQATVLKAEAKLLSVHWCYLVDYIAF